MSENFTMDKEAVIEMMKEARKHAVPRSAINAYVVGFDMPFLEMVSFMVKWAFAAIPAAIILFIAGAFMAAIVGNIGKP